MKNVKYDFSCVSIELPKPMAEWVIKWGQTHVSEDMLYNVTGFGHEDEPHITILYGIHDASPLRSKAALKGKSLPTVSLGRAFIFEKEFFDVLAVSVESDGLGELWQALEQGVDHSSRYATFVPHVTVAYLRKDSGWFLAGESEFLGETFLADEVVFKGHKGGKHVIL